MAGISETKTKPSPRLKLKLKLGQYFLHTVHIKSFVNFDMCQSLLIVFSSCMLVIGTIEWLVQSGKNTTRTIDPIVSSCRIESSNIRLVVLDKL